MKQLNQACITGKTTLLRHLLEQKTEKIGCVVNDVASKHLHHFCFAALCGREVDGC
jgi:G3E family GTPase